MPTRDYSEGFYGTNVYGEWSITDASATVTATSSFGFNAVRQYGENEYGINAYGVWSETDSGIIQITSTSSLSLSAAQPIDTYSSGEFGYGNYSAGTYRDASVTITGVSTVAIPDVTPENVTLAITVQSTDTGNKYFVNGVQQNMPIALKKGSTYKFDQSNASNNNHPLRFSTTNNGSWAGGSEYTDGVTVVGTAGQAGAYTQIVVANNAPSQLYTYCLNHSGMGFGVPVILGGNIIRIRNVSAVSAGSSTITCVVQRIHGALIPTTGTSTVSAVGNVTFSGNPFPINGVSSVAVSPVRVLFISVDPIVGASSTDFFARYKWEDVPITSTNWTNVYKVAA